MKAKRESEEGEPNKPHLASPCRTKQIRAARLEFLVGQARLGRAARRLIILMKASQLLFAFHKAHHFARRFYSDYCAIQRHNNQEQSQPRRNGTKRICAARKRRERAKELLPSTRAPRVGRGLVKRQSRKSRNASQRLRTVIYASASR